MSASLTASKTNRRASRRSMSPNDCSISAFHAPTIYFPLLFHQSIMIEPTEVESKQTLDAFIAAMRQVAKEAKEQPELVKTAPHSTPISRVDEVYAAKKMILTYQDYMNEQAA
jgi:glycine dehydrogenase subunit 2